MTSNDIKLNRYIGPGPAIKEQLELRGWTQEDLSDILGMSLKSINKLLLNKQSITIDTAKMLAEVFDVSPQKWINLDTNYRLSLKETTTISPVRVKSELYKYMPINELFKKGWLKRTSFVEELEKQIMIFWGKKTLDFTFLDKTIAAVNYRKSSAHSQYNHYAAETWCQMAKNSAALFKVKKFDKNKLEKILSKIHSYTIIENGVEVFLEDINNVGVIFMCLPHLQKTYIDGAAFIINETPVIVYTGRYKRFDNFWFTVAHEIAHILKGHIDNNGECIIDDLHSKGIESEIDEKEKEANDLANEVLLHNQIVNYLDNSLNYLMENDIYKCAEKFGIHPSIIIGALAHRKVISFAHLHTFNKDIMPLIPKKYFVENYSTKKAA